MLRKWLLTLAVVAAVLWLSACGPVPPAEAPAPTGEIPTGEAEIPEEGEAQKEVGEVPEEEIGIVHLMGTISANPRTWEKGWGLLCRAEGSGTIDLFIDEAEGEVTGKTTGLIKVYFQCTEDCPSYGYIKEEGGPKQCNVDDRWYNLGEWIPMPSWFVNLDGAIIDGSIAKGGFSNIPEEYDVGFDGWLWDCHWGTEVYDYGIGGWFVTVTEAEGWIDACHTDWGLGPGLDQYWVTWEAHY